MSTEPAKVTTELSEVTALAQAQDLPRDLALIKMENDSIMALAAARPRNYAAVLADIKQQLATFKSFAQHAMYAKPVGRDEQNRMKYARGLSIRAAEAIAAAYGYNRSRVDVTPLDEDTARIEATFVDYQTGRIWQKAGVVSKNYKDRYGKVRRHSDDRFYNVVCEAEGSKRVRECILRSVPPGLRSELELCVNEQLDSFLDDSTTQKLVASFSAKGITAEHLERIVGKRLTSLDREDRQTLIGLWNALEQGESTVSELIGDEDRPNTDQVIADVTRPVEPETKAPPEPPPAPPNETMTRGQPPVIKQGRPSKGQVQAVRAELLAEWQKLDEDTQGALLDKWHYPNINGAYGENLKGLQAKLEQVRDAQQAKPAPLAPTAQPAPDDAVIQRLRNSIGLAGMKLPVETRNRIFANNAMTTWNSIHQMGLQALRDLNQEVQDALATPD